jgi:anhydro-N-acetylmuramic acid kinase
MLVIGLISGTSLDAIDAAVVEIAQDADTLALGLRAYIEQPYPPRLNERLRALLPPAPGSVAEVCELHVMVGEAFAETARIAAAAAGLALGQVDLIASHGQTVYHQVAPGHTRSTLQLGAPAAIVEATGRTVVADFRPRDIAAGGQGAPLVPFLDMLVWSHPSHSRALQNIGGIGNVTYLPATGGAAGDWRLEAGEDLQASSLQPLAPNESVVAFDTGPGNLLIDEAVRVLSSGALAYDRDGAWAARGQVDQRLLAEWLADPYFLRPPPKSTGREYFSCAYAQRCLDQARGRSLSDADSIATLTALTAGSIAAAYIRFLPSLPDDLIVSGGGAHNPTLLHMLAQALPAIAIQRSDESGLPASAKEAVAFAALGYATLFGWPGNLPACTGARREATLGSLTPGDNYLELLRCVADAPRIRPLRAVLV